MRRATKVTATVVCLAGLAAPAGGAAQTSLGAGLEPDWSPDGRWVMVSVLVDEQRDLFLVSPDGERRRVTRTPESELLAKWSPDGRVSYVQPTDAGLRLRVLPDPRRGGGEPQDVELGELSLVFLAAPWTPDGSALTVVAGDYPESDIYRVPLDGAPSSPLVTGPGYDGTPAWSADGRLAFVSDRAGSRDVWIREPDGTERRLTTSPGREDNPAWSPDGRWVAYEARVDEDQDIYIMAADGSRKVRVTTEPARNAYPAWSPDGSTLAYVRVAKGRRSDELMIAPVPPEARAREDGSSNGPGDP